MFSIIKHFLEIIGFIYYKLYSLFSILIDISKEFEEVTLFVDVGNEIDDEQLALFIETIYKKENWIVTIVFCGYNKMSDLDSMKHWLLNYKYYGIENCTYGNNLKILDIEPNLTYYTLEEYISKDYIEIDYALVCASVKGWNGQNMRVKKMLFFQGNTEDIVDDSCKIISPKGLNAVNSEYFIDYQINQLKSRFIVIPSSRCAEMRPTSGYLKSLPNNFKHETAEAGFKLMVGRIPPNIKTPNGLELSKKIAAGLINKNLGRGANFEAVKVFMKFLDIDIEKDFCEGGKFYNLDKYNQALNLSKKYFIKIYDLDIEYQEELPEIINYYDFDNNSISNKSINWDKERSLLNLTLINLSLDYICPGIWDNKEELFYSNFKIGNCDKSLKKLREIYHQQLDKIEKDQQIGFLNPSYDLYTGYIFYLFTTGGIQKMNWGLDKATPLDFFQSVSLPSYKKKKRLDKLTLNLLV